MALATTHPLRIFGWSIGVSLIALAVGFIYGGLPALFLVLILGVFEVSLSFDNAVVNAKILDKMSEKWQKLFLSVGIIIAVFGMRLAFPLIIVGVTTGLNPMEAWSLAMEKGDPHEAGTYGYILHQAHPQIAGFGGMFLLMLFLDFILDADGERDLHWISPIEKRLVALGKVSRMSVILGLVALVSTAFLADEAHLVDVLISGAAGMLSYLLVNAMGNHFENKLDEDEENASSGVSNAAKLTGKAAFFSFLYLELIDGSFSFDGVIGAFAITTDPVIIGLGLGFVGAMFVRSITIFLVRKGTLNDYVYLDHGAHWAIGALAVILIVSIAVEVPEIVTGLLGVFLIVAALISSVAYNKKQHALEEAELEQSAQDGALTK